MMDQLLMFYYTYYHYQYYYYYYYYYYVREPAWEACHPQYVREPA